MKVNKQQNQTMNIGKLISTEDGKTSSPQYGEVYTAGEGEKGYVAGFRMRGQPSEFIFARRFEKLKAAQDYAVQQDMTLAKFRELTGVE